MSHRTAADVVEGVVDQADKAAAVQCGDGCGAQVLKPAAQWVMMMIIIIIILMIMIVMIMVMVTTTMRCNNLQSSNFHPRARDSAIFDGTGTQRLSSSTGTLLGMTLAPLCWLAYPRPWLGCSQPAYLKHVRLHEHSITRSADRQNTHAKVTLCHTISCTGSASASFVPSSPCAESSCCSSGTRASALDITSPGSGT